MKKQNRTRATDIPTEYTPRRRMSAAGKLTIVSLCLCAVVVGLLATAVGYAYFTKIEIYNAYFGLSMGSSLFDELDASAVEEYQKTVLGYEETELVAPTAQNWGTKENPYVISEMKHLYNLSELQNIGYFDKHFISKNYDENDAYNGGSAMPYFLVCTPKGEPVCIEGGHEPIKPIGTEQYPFIGSVKGAFVKDANGNTTPVTVTGEGKTSDVSTLHDIKIASTAQSVDVGLFGHISHLGDDPGSANSETGLFRGYVSEISGLLLYDVTVKVDRRSWAVDAWNAVTNHLFSYKADDNTVPHETNHLGILAGHVTYSKIELISIYYSATNIVAIDLSHTKQESDTAEANYMSSTGIIGFLNGLNPVITANGEIDKDSGTSSDSIQIGTSTGTGGGGALSGNERGYVIAQNVFTKYNFKSDKTPNVLDVNSNTPLYIRDAYDSSGNRLAQYEVRNSFAYGYIETENMYFYDGVFTFALSKSGKDVIAKTWPGTIPDITIGVNSDSAWTLPPDTTAAQESVVAYLKQIKTNAELKNYVSDPNKKNQLVITAELGNGAIYMMTLKNQSTPGSADLAPDQMYTTQGQHLDYASDDLLGELKSYYSQGIGTVPGGIVDADGNKLSGTDFANQLGAADGYQVVELGKVNSEAGIDIDTLNSMYKITGDVAMNEEDAEQYAYFENSTGMAMPGFDPSQAGFESYRYGADEGQTTMAIQGSDNQTVLCNGYFYAKGRSGNYYSELWWQPFSGGSPKQLFEANGSTYSISSGKNGFFSNVELYMGYDYSTWQTITPGQGTTTSATWQNEQVYVFYGKAGTEYAGEYYGIILDDQNHFINDSGITAAFPDGVASLYKQVESQYKVFIGEGDSGVYTYNGSQVTLTESNTTTDTGYALFSAMVGGDSITGFKVDKYPQFIFSTDSNVMQLLSVNYYKQAEDLIGSSVNRMFYLLYNGQTPAYSSLGTSTEHGVPTNLESTSFASVKFNTDGTCSIFYTNAEDNAMRYINYGGDCFNGSAAMPSVKLKMYILADTKDGANASGSSGQPTIVPAAGAETNTHKADEVIFFATSSQGTANNNPNNVFTLTTLADLSAMGWKDDNGNSLASTATSDTLQRKFQMTEGIEGGTHMDLWGVLDQNEGSFITAPVGTLGFNANIPRSCIAFRLNQDATSDQTIRVIVAVPTQYEYPGAEQDVFSANTVCYFNLWYLNEAGWQNGVTQTFDPAATFDRFYLPQSHPCTEDSEPGTTDYVQLAPLDAENKPTQRCYLNGNQVLVAYEFTMRKAGIYLLGATGFDKTTGKNIAVPTQIVYFSADGAASAGQDGQTVTGAKLGTIDFVYDNGQKVVTVQPVVGNPTAATGAARDYNYYYPSYTLLYFDNRVAKADVTPPFAAVNETGVRLRRWVNGNSQIQYARENEFVKFSIYAATTNADTLDGPVAWTASP